ncbi:hypothetical protein GOBAR_DD32031 [Gossypium barbadense]|nr:hypothetical protein GOBAR_DD32031 [Gossypium barbadense]
MRTAPFPDLSLQISPPSVSDCKAKEMAYDVLSGKSIYSDRSSTTDSGSSGSDLSHENGYSNPGLGEPTLSLGFEMADLEKCENDEWRSEKKHQSSQNEMDYNTPCPLCSCSPASWSNTKICLRVDECQGSNPSSCEESLAGGVTMYRTVKSTDKGSGQGQTDMSLNQRVGIFDLDGRLSSPKADRNASYSLKLSTPSPQTIPQRTQSDSWPSSMETNNFSVSNRGNGLTFKPNDTKVDGDKAVLHMSDRMKERLDSSSMSPSDMFLNLEITLGRPSWQMDYAESSNELTLLKC